MRPVKTRSARADTHLTLQAMKIRPFLLLRVAKQHRTFSEVARVILPYVIPGWMAKVLLFLIPAYLITIAVLLVLLFAWPAALFINWNALLSLLGSNDYYRALAVAALFVSGLLLYLARVYMRPVYGLLEIVIGVGACWSALTYPSANALPATMSLIGGIYIIIRGCDNIIDDKSLTETHQKQ